jgi:hypothetical protein
MPITKKPDTAPGAVEFSDEIPSEDVTTNRQPVSAEPVKQDRPVRKSEEDSKPQSYVHLADGSVLRVNNEDLPGASGTFNPLGHWQRGNKVYEIVGIYDVESVVEDN